MTDTPPRAPQRPRTWAAVDAHLFENDSILALSPGEVCLYLASILYSTRQLTDGHIPAGRTIQKLCAEVGVDKRAITALEREHLWIPHEHGGYTIKGYLDWQPSKNWWEHQRDRTRRKVADWRARNSNPERNRLHPRNVTAIDVELELRTTQGEAEVHYAGPATTENHDRTEPPTQGLTTSDRVVHDGAVAMADHPPGRGADDDAVGGIGGELEALMARLKPQGA